MHGCTCSLADAQLIRTQLIRTQLIRTQLIRTQLIRTQLIRKQHCRRTDQILQGAGLTCCEFLLSCFDGIGAVRRAWQMLHLELVGSSTWRSIGAPVLGASLRARGHMLTRGCHDS